MKWWSLGGEDAEGIMRRFKNRYLLLLDVALLTALPFALYALRFESFSWSSADAATVRAFAVAMVPIEISVLLLFGLYRRLWRYASVCEL
jgi:FlaA1/EpsC-like NDP-sugar epimerase